MPPYETPADAARARLRGQVTAAADLAALDGQHPGHWQLHHIALPADRPGDFTPIRPPEYAEQEASSVGELLGYLAEFMLTAGEAQRLAEHQPQADPEPG